MTPAGRRERIAAGLWILVAVVVWNLVYDLMITRAVQEFMFRAALHEAGRGPATTMAEVLDRNVYDAIWVSTLFASLVALAGFFTIRYVGRERERDLPPEGGSHGSTLDESEPRTPSSEPRA